MANPGERSVIKVDDLLTVITRAIRLDEAAFDFSDTATWKVEASGWDASDQTVMFADRDCTSASATDGDPASGVAALPLYSGRSLPGAAAGAVVVGATDHVDVTFPASSDPNVTRQAIYMTKAGGSTYYLVAEGPDGFAAAGFPVGDSTYTAGANEIVVGLEAGTPAADAVLTQLAPTVDESRTNGDTTIATPPTISSAVLNVSGNGTIDAGSHDFKAIDIRDSDTAAAREIDFEFRLTNITTGAPVTVPSSSRFRLSVLDRIK